MKKLTDILQEIEIRSIPLILGKKYILYPKANNILVKYIGKKDGKHTFEELETSIEYSGTDDIINWMFKNNMIILKNG